MSIIGKAQQSMMTSSMAHNWLLPLKENVLVFIKPKTLVVGLQSKLLA